MYAQTGKLIANPEKRAMLAGILLRAAERVSMLPGCWLYLVHADTTDDAILWVYELWDDQASHDASLQDELVQALIAEAMPLLSKPPEGATLQFLGGHGLTV
ncbi:MAG: putative quinol monooxygenase [Anaerolineales bacterium]|jgi:quinol monooxygenase YgiN